MPRPPTAHRHPHSNPRQFDLFCDPTYAAAQTPQWQALPAETRHTLTKLMVRLIFGHADELSVHTGIRSLDLALDFDTRVRVYHFMEMAADAQRGARRHP
jgi:hypothetical protein